MATADGRTGRGVSDRLFHEPHRFDFFQAVRILERVARAEARRPRSSVGHDQPDQEAVRFRSQPSLSFPPSAVAQVRPLPQAKELPAKLQPLAEMLVTFMGVTGPTGVLPYHYTALLLRRIREKDYSLRDFLDLFHHRAISLFYRAWLKYRLPVAYEKFHLDSLSITTPGRGQGPKDDFITWALYCLVGMGTRGLRGRLQVDDEALLFYGGHFAHMPRSAIVLEAILADYFGLPIRVLQLQGQWLNLPPSDQAVMPGPSQGGALHNQLGVDVVVGARVWDVQSKFRIQVGPLTYVQFQRFMPDGDALRPLSQLTRQYVGPEFDFDVQVLLRPEEVPKCQLGSRASTKGRLGWNTWSRTREFTVTVDDAAFSLGQV